MPTSRLKRFRALHHGDASTVVKPWNRKTPRIRLPPMSTSATAVATFVDFHRLSTERPLEELTPIIQADV